MMVRIRRKVDLETLHLPELRPWIGRTVEITIEERMPEMREEFLSVPGSGWDRGEHWKTICFII